MRKIFLGLASLLILTGCGGVTPIPPESTSTPVGVPITETPPVHTDLESFTPDTIDRLEQIGQWGTGTVHGIALSPDGNRIAVSTTTGIYLYDRKSLNADGFIDIRIGDANEPPACFTSGNLAFSPDGSLLAVAERDITLWDLQAGVVRMIIHNQITDPESIIAEIQFSHDGKQIVGIQKTASQYPCYSGWGSVVVYGTETEALILRHDISRYEESPYTIFLAQNGTARVSYGNTLLDFEVSTGRIRAERKVPVLFSMNDVAAVSYRWINNGDIGDGHTQSHILDPNEFEEIEVVDAVAGMIPRTDRLMIHENRKLTVRSLHGAEICSGTTVAGTETAFLPRMFSSDGHIAVSWNSYGFRAGDVHIWDLENCTISRPDLIFPEAARQLSISSDGRSVLTDSNAGYTFHVFDSQTGQLRFSLSGYDAQFSADGQEVYVVEDDAINAYDVQTSKYLYHLVHIESDYMTEIVVDPKGRFVVLLKTSDGSSRIVPVDSSVQLGKLPSSLVNYPYLSSNGDFMAVVNRTGQASEFRFWNLTTGEELRSWKNLIPEDGYSNTAFNSDFSQVATYGTDGYYKFVYVWNIQEFSLDHVLKQVFTNGDRSIGYLSFVPGDRIFFARGINPDALLFWDVRSGELLAEIPTEIHESELGNPIAFSPDGRLLLIVDSDGTIHVWGIKHPS